MPKPCLKIPQNGGSGVGVSVGDGVGDGVTDSVGLAPTEGVGVTDTDGVGVGDTVWAYEVNPIARVNTGKNDAIICFFMVLKTLARLFSYTKTFLTTSNSSNFNDFLIE